MSGSLDEVKTSTDRVEEAKALEVVLACLKSARVWALLAQEPLQMQC